MAEKAGEEIGLAGIGVLGLLTAAFADWARSFDCAQDKVFYFGGGWGFAQSWERCVTADNFGFFYIDKEAVIWYK